MRLKKALASIIPISAILVFGLLLRLPLLNGSFWLDEAAQALESARPLSQQLSIAQDFQPPLIHLLVFAAERISAAEWWLRTVAALIPGLATIFVTYLTGKKLFSRNVGLAASLLLATSSFHIFYSQELRPYSLPALWAVLSWWLLWEWSQHSPFKFLAWFTVVTVLGLYSSYLYPFLLFSQLIYITWQHRKKLPHFFASLAVTGLAFLPWIPSFLGQLHAGGALRQTLPGWSAVVSTPQLKALALVPAKFLFGVLNIEPTMFFIGSALVIATLLIILCVSMHSVFKKARSPQTKLLFIWLLIPLLFAWVVSFWVPIVQPKRVLYLLPTVCLLMGYVVDLAMQSRKKWITKIAMWLFAVVLGINCWSTLQYIIQPQLHRENWRALHQEIVTRYGHKNAVAAFAFDEPFAPWRWYDDGSFPTWSMGTLNATTAPDLHEKVKQLAEYDYVLLFDYLRDLTDSHDQLRTELWSLGYKEIGTIDYPNIGFVRIYSKEKAVAQLE